jgi:hypothetical protein
MPIQTNLSVSPYYDDFAQSKDYYKILFKPSVAVQVRELNQLQSILQNQIEQFGDNIFNTGTIISGCNFQYYSNYPYVKINDLTIAGLGVTVNNYIGLYANNAANLTAYIMTANSGYESQAPDLNTLFVRYINSGNTGVATAFSPQDVLTIFDSNNSIFAVNVPVGGSGAGFSNTDTVVFMPAITVTNTGAISNGALVNDPVSLANAIVVGVNTTAIPGSLVLNLSPYANALTNTSLTSNAWSFNVGNTVTINNGGSSVTGTIQSIIGFGATATPVTDGAGRVQNIIMLTQGNGYVVPPVATIQSTNVAANVTSLSLTAQNYLAQVTVANSINAPVGSGYAFGVSAGVIFQKGYFLYVSPQTIVVDKYSNTPDGVVVGFNTSEAIINSNIDPSLLDNSSGTLNTQAPGADRLQLTPNLVVLNSASSEANTEFFAITAFSQGQPYLQNQQTSYNVIGNEIAQNIKDTSGDFVIDPFLISTQVANNVTNEANTFQVTIDPGLAYISGKRVQTYTNYTLSVNQATATAVANVPVALNYGNYTQVTGHAGVFDFTIGDIVTFYDAPKGYYSSNTYWLTGNVAPPSTANGVIGTARIRSKILVPGTGNPGTANAVFNLYLYDINMNPGYNFRNVKSVYYISTTGSGYAGIADMVLITDPSTNTSIATVVNTNSTGMLFYHGAPSTKNANNINYIYRDLRNANSGGVLSIVTNGTEYHPYTPNSTLSNTQLSDLNLIPSANLQASANYSGAFTTTTTSNVISGYTGNALSTFIAGDHLKIFSNSTVNEVRRIVGVINSTSVQLESNVTVSNTSPGANVVFFHPQYLPFPVVNRPDRSANIDSTGQILTITLNKANSSSYFTSNVVFRTELHIQKVNPTPITKTTNRYTWVKLNLANVQPLATFTGTLTNGNTWITAVTGANTSISTGNGQNVFVYANVAGIPAGTYLTGFINTSPTNTVLNMSASATAGVTAAINTYTTNTTGPWCLGTPDVFRLKYVFLDSNTNIIATTANTGTLVTNQFYIDHNQNADFYDHGYLHLNQGSNLEIANGQGLLVAFDHFTNSSSGFYAGKVSYPTNDALSFATLNSTNTGGSVHTHEIPEFLKKNDGTYHDLIDHVDFRPRVVPTATVTYAISSATINPQILNANNRFGNNALLSKIGFPAPSSNYSSTIEYYLGRMDRVVIDDNGLITAIPGTPAANNFTPPPQPANTMTINLLYIPPYPSVAQQLSPNYVNIVDKSIASQTFTYQRLTGHTIAVPQLTSSQQQQYQPAVYTMADIGHLEARIAALEYYVSLSSLEQAVQGLTIPSSLNGTLNRFKYGFFADNFSSTQYTDTTNPEYNAKIVNQEVVPNQFVINIPHIPHPANVGTVMNTTGKITTLPFTPKKHTGNPVATVANTVVANTVANTVSNTVSNTVVANTVSNTASNTVSVNSTPVTYGGTSNVVPSVAKTETPVTSGTGTIVYGGIGGGGAGYRNLPK